MYRMNPAPIADAGSLPLEWKGRTRGARKTKEVQLKMPSGDSAEEHLPEYDFDPDKLNLRVRVALAADRKAVDQVVEQVMQSVRDMKCVNGKEDAIELALQEALANAVVHGAKEDPSKVIEYVVTKSSFDPKSVVKIRIKEEWVFDRESSRMFVRILGIAPLKTLFLPNGQERGTTAMFWVYYPDLRPMLAKYEVYNPKNMGMGRMTWEELFESRMFSSYIVKSTLDNPGNKNIRAYVRDPILALIEGDNIKDKIFNYEQDLWSY